MKSISEKTLETNLNKALAESLMKRFPNKASSKHLVDIINALMGCLYQGEIYLDFINNPNTPSEIKEKGWPEVHYKELLKSKWLSNKDGPIVLIEGSLSWRRWHMQMTEVTEYLIAKTQQNISINAKGNTDVHPNHNSKLNKDQLSAIEKISSLNLILLRGGPGTGKTSTVSHMLIKALALRPTLRIGLAAPTGKATRRLQESLKDSINNLEDIYRQKLNETPCLTLHKWLQATEGKFSRNQSNPIQLDLLVVDEMSMVDLSLMKGLLDALAKDSQLVLVGDSNQLPPVGSGAIWHHLHKENIRQKFLNNSINLSKVYRSRGDIAVMAEVINSNGVDTYTKKLMELSSSSNIVIHVSNKRNIPDFIINKITSHHEKVKIIANRISRIYGSRYLQRDYEKEALIATLSNDIFNHMEDLIVLCPRRFGLWSVDQVNKTMLGGNVGDTISSLPEGVPIICGTNQPEIGLANGDIGITIGEGATQYLLFRVMSEDESNFSQLIHPARLKKCDPAFAMTIHKAQGSEAKHVILLWPNELNNNMLKENTNRDYEKRLIYTGITRARDTLDMLLLEDING